MLSPMRDYELTEPITAKLLILQGDLDSSNAKEVDQLLQELRERHADFQLVRYSEAEEDFAIPSECEQPEHESRQLVQPDGGEKVDRPHALACRGVPTVLSLPKHLHAIGGQ
ncbi:hypothetical protein M3Y99_00162900 [Aphelenchoides fujianensis]|nr:hypothetical protein M3Y99_00162900 [Aphelenchoides fujianensis]